MHCLDKSHTQYIALSSFMQFGKFKLDVLRILGFSPRPCTSQIIIHDILMQYFWFIISCVQEEMARGQVALPHTKIVQGNSERSSSQQIGTLGQIHYVRDSESEYDSDEDPDNDLDI